VAAPALVTFGMFHFRMGTSLFDTVPTINDEVAFWGEIATFRVAGFNGGYHSTNEQIPPARFSRFDPKGPAYPVLYGLLAVVLGWKPWSGPVFHLLFLAAGTAAWLWACRPGPKQSAVAALLMATFWPCLLWLPTTMQEGLHCAFAFLIAAAVERSFTLAPRTAWQFAGPMLVIAACGLFRVTWAFLLFPWVLLGLREFSARGRVLGASAAAGLFVGLFLLSRQVSAPHILPEGIGVVSWTLQMMKTSPEEAWSFFVGHTEWNIRNLVLPDGGKPLEVLQRYLLFGMLALTCVLVWRGRKGVDFNNTGRWMFFGLNMAPLTLAVILTYDVADWRDYRVVAPHLLLSLLVLTAGPGWRWVLVPCAAHLAFLPAFWTQFAETHHDRVSWDREMVAAFRTELQGVLHYDPSRSGWDNTVLVPLDFMTYPLVAVPPGMGVNCILSPQTFVLPPRSRYLLLSDDYVEAMRRAFRLRPMVRTRMGWLCLNLDYQARKDGG
jgi:hypothetical protein